MTNNLKWREYVFTSILGSKIFLEIAESTTVISSQKKEKEQTTTVISFFKKS